MEGAGFVGSIEEALAGEIRSPSDVITDNKARIRKTFKTPPNKFNTAQQTANYGNLQISHATKQRQPFAGSRLSAVLVHLKDILCNLRVELICCQTIMLLKSLVE